jgi:hypothetical protein
MMMPSTFCFSFAGFFDFAFFKVRKFRFDLQSAGKYNGIFTIHFHKFSPDCIRSGYRNPVANFRGLFLFFLLPAPCFL